MTLRSAANFTSNGKRVSERISSNLHLRYFFPAALHWHSCYSIRVLSYAVEAISFRRILCSGGGRHKSRGGTRHEA